MSQPPDQLRSASPRCAKLAAIPGTPNAITPAWASEALAKSFPGVEVARVEVVDRHSGTTGRAKLRLDYAAGARGPLRSD